VSGIDHIDEEMIALLALGESIEGIDSGHLRACVLCQSKVDQLRAVVATSRSITDEDRLLPPPDAVWENIVTELEAPSASRGAQTRSRGARMGWFALAAAVGVLVGSLGTIVISDERNPAPTVAQAELEPLADEDVRGVAQVRQTANGPVLLVDLPGLPDPSGYYEVWMLSPNADSMISVGIMGSGAVNEFPLPAGMDMMAFPVVDVSLEEFDGDVTHSGKSVVRGELST
jgi:hypothetical protein